MVEGRERRVFVVGPDGPFRIKLHLGTPPPKGSGTVVVVDLLWLFCVNQACVNPKSDSRDEKTNKYV